MTGRGKVRRLTFGWRKMLLGLGVAGIGVAGVCVARGPLGLSNVQIAAADPVPTSAAVAQPAVAQPAEPTDTYSKTYVARFVDGKEGITREELGEYLIARFGEKVEHLINARIIEDQCKAHQPVITVTPADIDQKLAQDLKDLNIDKTMFVKDFLKARGKTLFEWKEDNLRLELMMMKLCQDELSVTEEDIQNAYESHYGEKVECRIIEWSRDTDAQKGSPAKTQEQIDQELFDEANAAYVGLVNNEEAFARAAVHQKNAELAAGGGKVRPFGRHTLDNEKLEAQAFLLQPGQVSPLLKVDETGGYVVIKCDQRIPANTMIPLDKVHDDLKKEVLERKGQKLFKKRMEELIAGAGVDNKLKAAPGEETQTPFGYERDAAPGLSKSRIAATLYKGQVSLTREDLGEYLIRRYGATYLDLLVNRRIIENAAKERNITVTDGEIETEFLIDAAKKKMPPTLEFSQRDQFLQQYLTPEMAPKTKETFIKEYLIPNKVSVFQYKEDIVRPRILLMKLCRDRVRITDKDLADAFEAHYGEKVECRMILWPNSRDENTKIVLQEWAKLHNNPELFEEMARKQASRTLAKKDGLLEVPIGHHTTGNDELEQKAFALQPGEISNVIGTPEGLVVLKCERRLPAAQDKNLDEVREDLRKEVYEKKTEVEMPHYFFELHKAARPQLLLQPYSGEDTEGTLKAPAAAPPR